MTKEHDIRVFLTIDGKEFSKRLLLEPLSNSYPDAIAESQALINQIIEVGRFTNAIKLTIYKELADQGEPAFCQKLHRQEENPHD